MEVKSWADSASMNSLWISKKKWMAGAVSAMNRKAFVWRLSKLKVGIQHEDLAHAAGLVAEASMWMATKVRFMDIPFAIIRGGTWASVQVGSLRSAGRLDLGLGVSLAPNVICC